MGQRSQLLAKTFTKHIPLTEYLKSPEDVKKAVSGAIFNHATRMLGNDVKAALDSSMGSVTDHEGVVLRGMEAFPVKVTGEFIVGGLQTAFREGVIKEVEEDIYHLDDDQRQKMQIASLPGSLSGAIMELKKNEVIKKAIGQHTIDRFIQAKKIEIKQQKTEVTPRELERYLDL